MARLPVLGPDKPCEWHKPSGLPYQEWHDDAERRVNAGEKQKYCTVCRRYFWPHEFGTPPKRKANA
jgi:hypothetical protein